MLRFKTQVIGDFSTMELKGPGGQGSVDDRIVDGGVVL